MIKKEESVGYPFLFPKNDSPSDAAVFRFHIKARTKNDDEMPAG